MSASMYWKKFVTNEATALEFYNIYYPHYPDALKKACIVRFQELISHVNEGTPTDADVALLGAMNVDESTTSSLKWDVNSEITAHKH